MSERYHYGVRCKVCGELYPVRELSQDGDVPIEALRDRLRREESWPKLYVHSYDPNKCNAGTPSTPDDIVPMLR
jgi:hypothetical protein